MVDGLVAFLVVLFVLASGWLCWILLFYPMMMLLLSKLRPRYPRYTGPAEQPTVAFVMAAYNEEKVMADRLENYLALDYPRDRLQFLIGSDASTDCTDSIVRSYARRDSTIELFQFDRCGKTRIVYELAELTKASIVVFTDADVLLDPTGLSQIVTCFRDPQVGGVIGRMIYTHPGDNAGNIGQKKYVEIENRLRRAEALVWTTVGPRGECFAVRKEAYTPLTNYQYSDDLNLVITIPHNGYRVWYEPTVVIRESSQRSLVTEYRRRLRMGQQAAATLMAFPHTRWPWRSWVAFEIWSHKLLRILAAVPLALIAITSLALSFQILIFRYVAAVIGLWLVLLGIGILLDKTRMRIPQLQYLLYFTAMIVSLTVGSVRGVLYGGLDRWSSNRIK